MSSLQKTKTDIWHGRKDNLEKERFYEFVKTIDDPDEIIEPDQISCLQNIALIGFACDEGVKRNQGRIGAHKGPRALRKALANICPHTEKTAIYDLGDILCEDGSLESSQKQLGLLIAKVLNKKDTLPILLGGGHEIAWGHWQGIHDHLKSNERVCIVNFDAHYDLRPLLDGQKGSSGTPFLQIAEQCAKEKIPFDYTCIGIQQSSNTPSLLRTAEAYKCKTVLADDIHNSGIESTQTLLAELVKRADKIYLTVCLDVFAQVFAPGVSAPQALGLYPWQVLPLLRQLITSPKVISFDIAELNPYFDWDQKTAKLAAQILLDLIRTREHVLQKS
ncbi:MAG: formimidoylglutamase [Oligoflexales bacterium]|nr:formimidoylglutamase [Oligoflexales bacterium]